LNEFLNSHLCLFQCSYIMRIEGFCLQVREEALHGGIVMTIASARHADLGANLWQHVVVSVGRVLESLVAVNDQSGHVLVLFERLGKGLKHELIIVTQANCVATDFQPLGSRRLIQSIVVSSDEF
jgi:hypothetical protein